MTPAYKFIVYGSVGAQGSKKFVGMAKGKDGREHARLVEVSKKVKPWRKAVKHAAEITRAGAEPLDGPLIVRMVFTMHKPMSAPKRRRTWPQVTPDLSKLCRSTEDALTDAGLWADDARVVEYERLAKVYPGEDPEALDAPGALIHVRMLVDKDVTPWLFETTFTRGSITTSVEVPATGHCKS